MNLDPSVSPWPGVIASVAVCLWIAAIGALLAYAVFRDRPRLVWPFYAPVVGVAVVLLVTNLAAYVAPGAPAAWVGLIGPSALGVVVVWRGGALRPLPRGSRAALLAMALRGRRRLCPRLCEPAASAPIRRDLALRVGPWSSPRGVSSGNPLRGRCQSRLPLWDRPARSQHHEHGQRAALDSLRRPRDISGRRAHLGRRWVRV